VDNNSVKYLQGIMFAQLTLDKKTEIENLGGVTHDLVISHHQAEYEPPLIK
jgi:hypothetical protein